MRSLTAAVAVVLLVGSTAYGACGCAVPVAPAPVVAQSYYAPAPVYTAYYPAPVYTTYYPAAVYRAPVVYPTAVYYPSVRGYAVPMVYPGVGVARTRVGPFGGVRTTYRYW